MNLLLRMNLAGAGGTGAGDVGAGGLGMGRGASTLARWGATLDRLRDEICDRDERMLSGSIPIPAAKQPLETGYVSGPERMLSEYLAGRASSGVGQMLAATKQLMADVDHVVVLGDPEHVAGAQALMQACCQPFYNQLSRAARGSRPRLLVVSGGWDNDQVQGVLHLLDAHRGLAAQSLEERWGLVVLEPQQKDSPLPQLARLLLQALQVNHAGDRQRAWAHTLLVSNGCAPTSPPLAEFEGARRFPETPAVPAGCSVLSMAGLLPAALVGINIMKLLEGAACVSQHFRTQDAAQNLVLQLAATLCLTHQANASRSRSWCGWSQALSATQLWYQQLLRTSLGLDLIGVAPWQLPQPAAGDLPRGLLIQVAAERFRFDRLPLATFDLSPVGCYQSIQAGLRQAAWPSVELTLPQIDEAGLGQLLQLLLLATLVERRLTGAACLSEASVEVRET